MRHLPLAALGTQPLLGLARASPYGALLCPESCQSCPRASSAMVLPAALQAGRCLLQAAQERAGGAWVLTVRLQGISLSRSSAQFLHGGEHAAARRRIVSEPRFIHAQGLRVGGEPASLPGSCTCKMLRCFFHCLEVILTNGAFLSSWLLCVHTQGRWGGQAPCAGPVAPCPVLLAGSLLLLHPLQFRWSRASPAMPGSGWLTSRHRCLFGWVLTTHERWIASGAGFLLRPGEMGAGSRLALCCRPDCRTVLPRLVFPIPSSCLLLP